LPAEHLLLDVAVLIRRKHTFAAQADIVKVAIMELTLPCYSSLIFRFTYFFPLLDSVSVILE